MKILNLLLVLFFVFGVITAQEADITVQLKQIKNGEIDKANVALKELRAKYPNDPAVIFLDALLTKDGDLAFNRYETIVRDYPKSQYADAALYCMFSYQYAMGNYKKAEAYLTDLKVNYPNSLYIKNADRNLDLKPDNKVVKQEKKVQVIEPIVENTFKYSIQAGAFLNLDKAKELQEMISKAGFKTQIKEKNVGGTDFNLVLVGQYKEKDDAKEDLEALDTKFSVKGRVVEVTE